MALSAFLIASVGISQCHRLKRRHFIWLAIGLICLLIIEFLVSQVIEGEAAPWQATLFFGSALLVLGWIITNEITIINHRKQHTINLISDYMINSTRLQDRDVIKRALPRYTYKLTPMTVAFDDETSKLIQAIDRELNFFEFVAIGLETDDLDRNIVDRSLKSMASAVYRQMEDYIDHWRVQDDSTWEHFARLYQRWNPPEPNPTR